MEIKIGKYRIQTNYGKVWIFIYKGDDEGEGMEVSEKKFEKVIEKFYEDVF